MAKGRKFMELVEEHNHAEWDLFEEILAILGVPESGATDTWPILEYWVDPYDASVELVAKHVTWEPTLLQMKQILDLGFARCWVNYYDGTELYYTAEKLVVPKRTQRPQPRANPAAMSRMAEIAVTVRYALYLNGKRG